MRLIFLEICAGIVALLFTVSLVATASHHRARLRAGSAYPTSAVNEYLWALVPWVILAAGAFPAVRLIVARP